MTFLDVVAGPAEELAYYTHNGLIPIIAVAVIVVIVAAVIIVKKSKKNK